MNALYYFAFSQEDEEGWEFHTEKWFCDLHPQSSCVILTFINCFSYFFWVCYKNPIQFHQIWEGLHHCSQYPGSRWINRWKQQKQQAIVNQRRGNVSFLVCNNFTASLQLKPTFSQCIYSIFWFKGPDTGINKICMSYYVLHAFIASCHQPLMTLIH